MSTKEPAPTPGTKGGKGGVPVTLQTDKPLAFYPCTDIDNANRLIYYYGDNLRYCYQAKRWFVWTGKNWEEDRSGHIDRCAEAVARKILEEANKEKDADEIKKKAKWALGSMSNSGIKNMIERAQSKAPIRFEDFDQNDYLLNCQNGILDLKTGKLLPHKRELYITKIIPIEYDPNAYCPTWNDFLYKIMESKEHLVSFLQRAIGYSLTGDIREQVMFLLHGGGSNGKSTLIEVLLELLADYGQQTPPETLMAKRSGSIPNDVARMRGSRLAAAIESDEGRRLGEVLVKQLTGGDIITARFLNQEFFEFKPTFKIFLATNHLPQIKGTDDGIWRRLPRIPFNVKFWNPAKNEEGPEDLRMDKALPDKLKAELPGILAWAVKGCLLWQEEGLNFPDEVVNATKEYRADMDTLQDFLTDRCIVKATATCKNPDLYAEYIKWCEDTGEPKITQKALTMSLKERGFTADRSADRKSRIWNGLGLISGQQELL